MTTTTTSRIAAALAALMAAMFALGSVSAFAQDSIGIVKRCKGDVFVERAGARLPAPKGTVLYRGDRLVTGRDAYAYVNIRGAAPIAVGPETHVTLDRYVSDEQPAASRAMPRLLSSLASYLALNLQR
jgi:hypothetical protein